LVDNGLLERNGLRSSADRTAFFGAVGVHPFPVGLAFTVLSPSETSSVTLLFVGFAVFVFARFSDGRALVFVFLAFGATRLHTVSSHPLFVFGAFLLFGPSVTRRMSINGTEIVSLGADTCSNSQSVSTSASRAARSGAVGEHKVGVSGTFRSSTGGPLGTGSEVVEALVAVGRTQGSVFLFQSFPFLFLFGGNSFGNIFKTLDLGSTVKRFLQICRFDALLTFFVFGVFTFAFFAAFDLFVAVSEGLGFLGTRYHSDEDDAQN